MKTTVFLCAVATAGFASAATVESVSVSQMWPVSTDVKVSYVLGGVSEPVDVSVAVFDGETEISLDGTGNDFLRGDVYGVATSGAHVLYLDPTQLKSSIPGFTSSFKVKLALSASPANINESIYKILDINDGTIRNLTRADIKNGRYGSWTDDMEATFGITNSMDDILVWTGVTNDLRWAKDKMVFRKIPAGGKTFRMGAQDGEADASATRQKAYYATLSKDFWIGVFEVTQYQYAKIQNSNPSRFKGADDSDARPVENVSWYSLRGSSDGMKWSAEYSLATIHTYLDASCFIKRLRNKNASELSTLDLPSEVQWEAAARANVADTFYDGYLNVDSSESNASKRMNRLGRYSGNSTVGDVTNGTSRVGSYIPNQYGLYDVLGNVMEWTGDVFMETPANQTEFPGGTAWVDPVGGFNTSSYDSTYNGATGNYYRSAKRGGYWAQTARASCLSYRTKDARQSASDSSGVRLCITED